MFNGNLAWFTWFAQLKHPIVRNAAGWSKNVHLTAYVLYVKGATTAGFDGLLHKILMNLKVIRRYVVQ